MRKRNATVLLVTAILIAIPAVAASSTAQLSVSVQVIARTILSIDSEPASVEVSAADIARGYVDLPQSVAFHVHSNDTAGYTLQFEPLASPFSKAAVTWADSVASYGSDGTWLTRAYQQGTVRGTMSIRLTIAAGTQPGTYAWPVVFEANSL